MKTLIIFIILLILMALYYNHVAYNNKLKDIFSENKKQLLIINDNTQKEILIKINEKSFTFDYEKINITKNELVNSIKQQNYLLILKTTPYWPWDVKKPISLLPFAVFDFGSTNIFYYVIDKNDVIYKKIFQYYISKNRPTSRCTGAGHYDRFCLAKSHRPAR